HATAPFYSVLIRINPENPSSTSDFVCDLCTEMPRPTDDDKTYTYKIRDGVKFHDGSPLTAADVAASWQRVVSPPAGVTSARQAFYTMVDKVESPDPSTVVFRLKFATTAFLPALADPFAYIYKKAALDQDPHWYEKYILGSGPFKFVRYETGQSVTGERNPDYYHKGLPHLDGFTAIYAPKLATRVDAIRADRAAMEFRSEPPSARDQLVKELGDQIAVQESDWNCGNLLTYNHKRKPFDDVRVRRALSLAIDQWKGAPALSKIAIVRTVAGIVFPGSPLAATMEANCQSVVNPVLDVGKYLPHTVFTENYGGYEDPAEIELYQKMLREADPAKQRLLMREFEKYVIDTQAHELPLTFWYRIVPYRSYVKGWKISPSHFVNQDLATIWLDK